MGARPTVLLIDTDRDILNLLDYAFRSEGFDTVICTEPEDAVGHVARGEVDCAVVDLHHARTPECLGFLNAVRELPRGRSLPVLVTSAGYHAETVRQALRLGARKFIPKPFYPSELLSEVRAAVAPAA
ncbi:MULTISPECIES: response regulator [Deferrisoma]